MAANECLVSVTPVVDSTVKGGDDEIIKQALPAKRTACGEPLSRIPCPTYTSRIESINKEIKSLLHEA